MARLAHRWDLTPAEAVALQRGLGERVELHDRLGPVRTVAGIDIGFEDGGRVTRAAACLLSFPALELVDFAVARRPTEFPYVPGLLSFREAPAAIDALARLRSVPDVVLYDGQGIAHPRRVGIASHVGLLADIPTVGVAKTLLVGSYGELADERGASSPLVDRGDVVGAALRTRRGVKPLYVSIGHRVGLETAIELVMGCVTRYRLPETTRWAHRIASVPGGIDAARRAILAKGG